MSTDSTTKTSDFKNEIAKVILSLVAVASDGETDEKTLAYYDRVRAKVADAILSADAENGE